MVVGVFSVVLIIGILFGITIYIYENSTFYKMTNYSYMKLLTDQNAKDTYKLTKSLSKLNGEHKLVYRVKIPLDHEQTIIDAIVLHESGIYVVNVYNKTGWIYGKEQDDQWVEVVHKEKMEKFENPIIRTKKEILQLKEQLPNVDETLFHTLVVFNDGCSFRKIEMNSLDVDVVKMSELKQYWEEPLGISLTKEQIESCYAELEKRMDFTNQVKKSARNAATE